MVVGMAKEINYSGKPQLYYAPFELVIHNKPTDCWVSYLGKVCDITPLIKEYENQDCIRPLLIFAGKDISEWFDPNSGDIVHYIHPITGCRVPYIPHGPIPDVHVQVPATSWKPLDHIPWWKDDRYKIGLLTKRVRPLRIINPLFGLETYLNVCAEDTIMRIKERYSVFNSDADMYIWRCNGKPLNDNKTLEENGIIDEREKFASVGLSPTFYIPSIMIYYTDDLHRYKTESDSD